MISLSRNKARLNQGWGVELYQGIRRAIVLQKPKKFKFQCRHISRKCLILRAFL